MSYTVKIIDNDNGAVVIDRNDACAIIGSVVLPEGTEGIYSTSCSADKIAMGVFGAQKAIEIAKKNPVVNLMVAYAESRKDEIEGVVVDLSPLKRKKNGD